jgi:hypothetical protein
MNVLSYHDQTPAAPKVFEIFFAFQTTLRGAQLNRWREAVCGFGRSENSSVFFQAF